jgi:hypothetical protein
LVNGFAWRFFVASIPKYMTIRSENVPEESVGIHQ